ncbi:MAG TPA: antibiotic biosynthesis monooxygenase [Thermoanaerobaculia bacterium]|nr:antibiotic biosynthesis monooxygenase [Thermoanaerobaculia bacterium]
MFARNVTFSIKPNMDHQIAVKFEKEVLPLLRKANGFRDQITLSRDKNEIVGISLWENREQLDAYVKDTDAQVVRILSPLFNGTPDVRTYEVTNSTNHKVAAA